MAKTAHTKTHLHQRLSFSTSAPRCKERGKRFGVCYTPFRARCVGWAVGRSPSSVRGKCARQPGPLSMNALERTLNGGTFFQVKHWINNSQSHLFFIFSRLFYEARARSTKGRNSKYDICHHFSFPFGGFFMSRSLKNNALNNKGLSAFLTYGKHSRDYSDFMTDLCTCWPFSVMRQSC